MVDKRFFLTILTVISLVIVGTTKAGAEELSRGKRLLQKAHSFHSENLDRWINKAIKKYGPSIVEDAKFQRQLIINIKKIIAAKKAVSGGFPRKRPKLKTESDGFPGKFAKLRGPMWMAGVGYSASFAKETDNLSGATSDGLSGGAGGGMGGNSQTLMLRGALFLNPTHSFNGMYMRFLNQQSVDSSSLPEGTSASSSSALTQVPTDVFAGGYRYSFQDNLSLGAQGNYSNGIGVDDPTLSLEWKSAAKRKFSEEDFYSASISATAPLSEYSKKTGKISTIGLSGGYTGFSVGGSYFFKGGFSYTGYNKDETMESILADLGLDLNAPDSGGSPSDGMGDEIMSQDINLLSREVYRNFLSVGKTFNFGRDFSVGLDLSLTHSYLESTYSLYTTSINWAKMKYDWGPSTFEATLGTTSPSDQKIQIPADHNISLSYTYNFGNMPKKMGGGGMGP